MGRGRKEETGSKVLQEGPQRACGQLRPLEQVKAVDEFSSAGDRSLSYLFCTERSCHSHPSHSHKEMELMYKSCCGTYTNGIDEPIFRAGTDRDADVERGRVGMGGGGRGSGDWH